MRQSDKIKWGSSTGKLKNLCGSPHIEMGVTFTQKKENTTFTIVTNRYTSGAVPKIKQKQLKVKRGRKSSKLKETRRSSKIFLSEGFP